MAGVTVRLGPFVAGLNNQANTPDTIGDSEVFECVNFDYDNDGALITRPAIAREPVTSSADNNYCNILGFFTDPATGDSYTVANIYNGLYYRKNSTKFIDAGSWVSIYGIFGTATAGIQYVDKFYFVRETGAGAYWSLTTGYVNVSSMPSGNSIALFKERLWISSGTSSRLYFSDIATGDSWTSGNFIDVNAGDGQFLNCVYAGPSALYLFKTNSTFVLTYDSAVTSGYIQNISTTIGLFDPHALTAYEGVLYLLYGELMYELNGYTFTRISNKIDLARGALTNITYPSNYSVSTMGDRIMVQYYNLSYVYYPLIGTWTQWNANYSSRWFLIPNSLQKYKYKVYLSAITVGSFSTGNLLVLMDKDYVAGDPLDITNSDPYFTTKLYALDLYRKTLISTPESWKRLYWWGVDAIVNSSYMANITLEAIPYNLYGEETWALMATNSWDTIGEETWDEVLTNSPTVVEEFAVQGSNRKTIKTNLNLRYTRIQFKITFTGYGYTAKSSVNHILVNFSPRQDRISITEGTPE